MSWSAAKQVINFLLGFGSSIILARLLTPREFGVYALALATQGVLFSFTAFSVGAYLIREENIDRQVLRQAFTVNGGLALLLVVALHIAAWLCDVLNVEQQVSSVLRILSIGPLLNAIEFIPAALLAREMNFRFLALAGILRAVLASGIAIALAVDGFGPASLAVGQVAGATAAAFLLSMVKRRDLVFRPTFVGLKPIISFGVQLMSIGGVAQLATRLSDLILGRSLGLAALGLYTRASSVSSMIYENVYGLITGVMFSKLSQDLREKGSIRDVYLRSLALITGLLWPALIGMAVLSRPMVHLLYGERWLSAALPLSLLMIAQFIALGFSMNLELFVLRHETGRQTRIEVIRATFGILAFTAGALFSIAAAAVGRIVEVTLGYLLYRPHMDRLAGVAAGELNRVYRESLLLTAVAVAPSFALMVATGWRSDVQPLWIFAAVLIGATCWFAVLVRRDHVLVQELGILRRAVLNRQ